MITKQTLLKSWKFVLLVCLFPGMLNGAEPGAPAAVENRTGFALQQYSILKLAFFKKIQTAGPSDWAEILGPVFKICNNADEELAALRLNEENYTPFLGTIFTYDNTTSGTLNNQSGCGTTLTRTFTVSDNFNVLDLNVGLNFDHTWRGDVRVRLTSPLGTVVTLIAQDNSDSYDHQDVMLDDESGNAVNNGSNNNTSWPYYDADRSAAPNNPLSAFDGQNAFGTWTLEFCNVNQGGSGGRVLTFNSARLVFDGTTSEICGNGFDDDGDGLVDEADADCSGFYLEPECATIGSNWNTVADASASNGNYLTIQNGLNSTGSAPTGTASRITFTFNVSVTGNYKVFGRVKTPTGNDDSFWVRANGGTWYKWNDMVNSNWTWVQVYNSDNAGAFVLFPLTVGSNTIDFAYREDGAQLDKIFVTLNGTTPSGTGATAANCIIPEICNNGIDDDLDGYVDYADPDCYTADCTTTPGQNNIVGTVFFDQNSSQVFDHGENIGPGVTVKLYEDKDEDGRVSNGDVHIQTDVSDIGGAYSFSVNPSFTATYSGAVHDGCNDGKDGRNDENKLEFGKDKTIGVRFDEISIPAGATISSAYLYFTANKTNTNNGSVNIYAEKVFGPQDFCSNKYIATRVKTTASVNWSFGNWIQGAEYQSADVKSVIQEIVNSYGSYSNGKMAFLLISNGSNNLEAKSYETNDGASGSPRLVINYTGNITADYVVELDESTLPNNTELTMSNELSVVFSAPGQVSCDNNFGYNLAEICNNGVDDNGNGLIDCDDPSCKKGLRVLAQGEAITCNTKVTISAHPSGGTGPYSYAWSNGLGSLSSCKVNPSATTTYTVTLTDANGCTATDQVTITIDCSDPCAINFEDPYLDGLANTLELIPAGSYIINMGVQPQTISNALKPYGLVWELLEHEKVPIKWAINSNKTKDGVDFTYNGADYRGGPFIILAPYRTSAVNARIANWESQGVIGVTTVSDFQAPVHRTINYSMNWTLDQQNGDIAEKYLQNAGIPNTAYDWVLPQNLDCCHDVFVMPHAEPEWATHSSLLDWNDCIGNGGCGGAIWAGCKAVSELENIYNPSNPNERMNFLMLNPIAPATNPAVWSGDHDDGSMSYQHNYHDHPVMQFLGNLNGAQESGAEQVYLPTHGWRPSTLIGIEDTAHPDIPSESPGPAAKLAFGYAFGDPHRGFITYEAAHDLAKSTNPANIAAQRAFLNFSFMAVYDKAIKPVTAVPTIMQSGQTYNLTVTATGGSGNYTFSWSSGCGGTIANPNSNNTTFIAPTVSATTTCLIQLTVTDDCGTRTTFNNIEIEVNPVEICNNGLDDDGDGLVDNADPDCIVFCPAGGLSFQRWTGISGVNVSDLTSSSNYPNNPAQAGIISSFDGPDDYGDNYGTRVRGYISPSVSGTYSFNLTCDDGGQLFLSTDAAEANKVLIASVSGWTNVTEHTKYPEQTSANINLTAGQNYYVELLQKEAYGGDHFQVYWKTPTNATWTIIPGANLVPFQCSEICGNGLDDDGDSLIDNADPDCSIVFKQLYLSDPSQALDRIDPVATADATTATTPTLSGAPVGVVVDATSTNSSSNPGSTSFTVSHTTGTGANRLMLVGISQKNKLVNSVTYGSTPLTLVGEVISNGNARVHLYRLLNPPSGTANVVVNLDANPDKGIVVGVTTFTGVDQTTPLGLFAGTEFKSYSPSINVSSASGELVYNVVTLRNASLTVGSGQIQSWNINSSNEIYGGGSTKDGSSTTSMSWSASGSQDWAIGAVSIKPAPGGIPSTTFTQSPALCSPLTIKAGQTITVTNYITITSGTMPASPNITALLKYGSTNIISLTNPTYNSSTGLLTWTSTLGSDVTVPAGQAIALQITTAQAGVTFTINYDSQTKPSKVNLPVSTYIDITSFEIYNAPYPGGSIITNLVGGATVYPRAVVTDPFGSSDITGLDITITPAGSTVAATSVATAGCTRTYEYAWAVPSSAGTYNLTATAKEGFENTVTDVFPLNRDVCYPAIGTPAFTAGASSNRCSSANTVTYTATSANSTSIIYTLDAASLTAGNTIVASTGVVMFDAGWSGTSTITATASGCGGPKTATHTITTYISPVLNLSANVSICSGASTTLAASASSGTLPYTYTWSHSLGTGANKTVTPVSTTTYTVTLTDNTGCTATSQVTVTVNPAFAASAGPDVTICNGNSTTLTATTSGGGTAPFTFEWDNSLGNGATKTVAPVSNKTYTVTITDAVGCTATSQVTVSVSTLPGVDAGADVSICNGGSTNLTAVGSQGNAPYSFNWSNGLGSGNTKTVNPATTTTYTVTLTDATGCTAIGQVVVTVNPAPTVNAGSNVVICQGSSTTLTAAGSGGSPGYSYSWSNSLGSGASKIVSPASTTTYTVTLTDTKGCTATSQVTVNVNPVLSVSAGSNTTICGGTSATLTATPSGGNGPYAFAWNNGLGAGATKSVSPVSNTTYIVTVTDNSGCTATGQVVISVNSSPAANAGPGVTICKFFSTTLTASASGGTTPYSYSWSDGLGSGATKTVIPLSTKTYTVTVTSANGCLSTSQVTVTVQNCLEICGSGIDDDGDGLADCADSDCGPTATLSPPVTICTNGSTTLSVSASGGNGVLTYAWSHGLGGGLSKTVSPSATTTYSVTVTASGSGCSVVASSTVTVSACPEICDNGIDDDGDGLTDCADPDCAGITVPVLVDDVYTTCPGLPYSNRVTYNDGNLLSPVYTISSPPANGMVTIDATGKFYYTPLTMECTTDEFYYQVCNSMTGCCATAKVTIILGDTTPPVLTNVPADMTISCDDAIPAAGVVTAFDTCPGIYVEFDETSGQYEAGACETYNIIRTWTATDLCGNSSVGQQTISVVDLTRPELFQVYTLQNGSKLMAGISRRVTHRWKYVKFPAPYSQPPVVLTQLVSSNDPASAMVRMRNVSTQGFEIRLREEEGADGVHDFEDVAWMAISSSSQNSPYTFEAGTLSNVSHLPKTFNFTQLYSEIPLFFSTAQTANESDPAVLRHSVLTNSMVELSLQEEISADAETVHANETVGYLTLQANAVLKDHNGQEFAETGRINLTNAWTTVNLTNNYTKPVILFGGLTKNEADPVNVRMRHLTSNSFEVHLEEWNYQDGNHAVESVSYIVVEGSIPAREDFYCSLKADILKPGVNIYLVDNCDDYVNVDFKKSSDMTVTGLKNLFSWVASDDCDNKLNIQRTDTCSIAAVKLKALLSGALQSGPDLGKMRDDLRVKLYVPAVEPYSIVPGFTNAALNYEENEYENSITTTNTSGGGGGGIGGIGGGIGSGNIDLYPDIVFGFRTANNGDWSSPATWQGGVVPPFDCSNGQAVRIDHQVTVTNQTLKLDNSAKLYVVNGKLTLTQGNLEVYSGSAVFDHAELNCSNGDLKTLAIGGQLTVKNCTVNVSGNFSNEKATRTMQGVCLTVGGSFSCKTGLDFLTNVCGTIQNGVRFDLSIVTIVNSSFKVVNGDFENRFLTSVFGSNLTIWVANGMLKNSGFWTATLSNYCVSGTVTIPNLYLPALEACGTIAGEFNACDCSFNDPNAGGTNNPVTASPQYETIADGNWTSAATWKDGLAPPTGDIANKVIKIKHNVTLTDNNLKLKSNSTFVADSCSFTMSNGDFVIENAKAYFSNASFTSPNGELSLNSDSAYLEMTVCTLNIDEQFKNRKGTRKLQNVCMTLNDDFINDAGRDTLINVCAVVEKDFRNDNNGKMHLYNTKVKSNTGKFENTIGSNLTGDKIVIWLLANDLTNGGSWKGLVSSYCIAGKITMPQTYRPLTQECNTIQSYFQPCDCSGGNSTNSTTTITAYHNRYVAVGKMDVRLIEVTGDKAPVDWVVVELRDSADSKKILKSITALVTRDGEVVSEEGDSILYFPGMYEGNYYVTVRHRNHFGMMTETPKYLGTTNPPLLDFTDGAFPVKGGAASGKVVNGKRTMWAGDFNGDGKIIYQGPNNDIFYMFSRVLADSENTSNLANYIINGYEQQDINLDGKVIYQGPNNDRAFLLFNSILSHPQNMGMLANFVVLQNLP